MFGRRRLPSRSLLGPEPRIHAPKAGGRRQTRTFSAVAGSSLVIFMVLRSRSYCSQIARTVAEPDFFRGGADFDDGEGWRIFSLRDWFVVYGQKIEQ